MEPLTLGFLAHSRKPDERRLPIHPSHLSRIDPDLRSQIFLETGYAERFGVPDEALLPLVGGIRSHQQLVAECDVIALPKPTAEDVAELRAGQVLWGWAHAVQDQTVTQLSIERRLTLITWEAMNHWEEDGTFNVHVFHKNNELAGYCSVLHAMELNGVTGAYGRPLRAAVISFGATGRGAVTALSAMGIFDVTVLTQRDVSAVAAPISTIRLVNFDRSSQDRRRTLAIREAGPPPLAAVLAEHDIVVNCILQDTDDPLIFVMDDELALFDPGTIIVDVSCDEGMGFEWARPTSFAEPMLTVGNHIHYYAVDHSPSYLWNSTTWEISEALLPYLRTVMDGPGSWDADETISRAIEIREGTVLNPKILSFQNRSPEFPHPKL
jgi:alanine dehydrogenase